MTDTNQGSIILPTYLSGTYYTTHKDPNQDSSFKADAFLRLFAGIARRYRPGVASYADVGCGGGGVAVQIAKGLSAAGYEIERASGYDVSPHVERLSDGEVNFYRKDFCSVDVHYSLATVFDVVEHVPDPVGFLRSLSSRCDYVGLHIPLDRSFSNCLFDRFRRRMLYPGHISIFDVPGALNLVTMAGITPIDYAYTHGYTAPSGTMTWLQRAAFPVRFTVAHLSPWLASRTVGGVSLMVFGATRTGLDQMTF